METQATVREHWHWKVSLIDAQNPRTKDVAVGRSVFCAVQPNKTNPEESLGNFRKHMSRWGKSKTKGSLFTVIHSHITKSVKETVCHASNLLAPYESTKLCFYDLICENGCIWFKEVCQPNAESIKKKTKKQNKINLEIYPEGPKSTAANHLQTNAINFLNNGDNKYCKTQC